MTLPAAMEPELVQKLVQTSRDALRNAYCPYSTFPVGAALLTEDGSIYTGTFKDPRVCFKVFNVSFSCRRQR